ncbi:hypothetical protein NVP1112O_72 [Vibrio phage 1.112.O._10N.286.46.B11]|nr:hypothetical protein NVP1112O_72 [Vibrio phage 1.112.O._10N.286.46.B11]
MEDKIYNFSTKDAVEHGIDAAIILHNMRYWLDYARAHGEHEYDGYYWMYAKASKMQTVFPFWTANKIQKTLKKLEDSGVIISGSFNSSAWDRTKWYTLPEFSAQLKRDHRVSQTADCSFSQNADSLYGKYKDSNSDARSPKKQSLDYDRIKEIFNTSLTKASNIVKLTEKRKKLVKKLFDDFELDYEKFVSYLTFLNEHPDAQWMFERRIKTDGSGQYWNAQTFEYFVSEKCFLNAKENMQ